MPDQKIPVDAAGARHAAIVFGYVNMNDVLRTEAKARSLVFFLDVGVEAVVHHLDVGVVDGLDEADGLRGGREEIDLEAVEIFGGDHHAAGLGFLTGELQGFDTGLEFVWGGSISGEHADGRVGGAAEDLAAERLTAFHDAVEVGDGGVADRLVGRDRVGLRGHDGDPWREPQRLQSSPRRS